MTFTGLFDDSLKGVLALVEYLIVNVVQRVDVLRADLLEQLVLLDEVPFAQIEIDVRPMIYCPI